jgi:hypothetical protein
MRETMYLDRHSCLVFPGSAGVSPAQKAAILAALPGYKLHEHHGNYMMFWYLDDGLRARRRYYSTVDLAT